MSLTESANQLVDSIIQFPQEIADVAAQDPLSAVFVALGTIFITASVAVLGYLSLGALLSVFTVESPQAPRREAR